MVISTDLSDPRGIAVYPSKGLMFWTDHGGQGKVERAAMDGSSRQSLVQRNTVRGPVGITLDYIEDKVYWLDDSLRTMWKMDLDGGKRFWSALCYVTAAKRKKLHHFRSFRALKFESV